MGDDLHTARVAAKRLERYSHLVKDKVWSGDRRDLINALADLAETSEIARRLYTELGNYIQQTKIADEAQP